MESKDINVCCFKSEIFTDALWAFNFDFWLDQEVFFSRSDTKYCGLCSVQNKKRGTMTSRLESC